MVTFTRVTHKHHGYHQGFKYFYQYRKSEPWADPQYWIRRILRDTYGDSHAFTTTDGYTFNGYWLDDRKRHRIYMKHEADTTMRLLKLSMNQART